MSKVDEFCLFISMLAHQDNDYNFCHNLGFWRELRDELTDDKMLTPSVLKRIFTKAEQTCDLLPQTISNMERAMARAAAAEREVLQLRQQLKIAERAAGLKTTAEFAEQEEITPNLIWADKRPGVYETCDGNLILSVASHDGEWMWSVRRPVDGVVGQGLILKAAKNSLTLAMLCAESFEPA